MIYSENPKKNSGKKKGKKIQTLFAPATLDTDIFSRKNLSLTNAG